jgi:hypothetical protein
MIFGLTVNERQPTAERSRHHCAHVFWITEARALSMRPGA